MKVYLKLREDLVDTLLKEVSVSIVSNSSAKVSVLDFGPLFSLGQNNLSWQSGVNLEVMSSCAVEIHPTFCFSDPKVFQQNVDKYVDVLNKLPKRVNIVPALRVILPQVGSKKGLQREVDYLKPYSQSMIFYNHGFMAYGTLQWIFKSIAS